MQGRPFDPTEPKWLYRGLKRVHELATNAVFNEYGIGNLGQPTLLFMLEGEERHGRFPTQREIARDLNLSPTTITVSLKSLEKHGCINKLPDDEDMRKNRISLTEKGREITKKCAEASDKVDETMYLGFSDEEIALISSFYIRMTENLRTLTGDNRSQKEDSTC